MVVQPVDMGVNAFDIGNEDGGLRRGGVHDQA